MVSTILGAEDTHTKSLIKLYGGGGVFSRETHVAMHNVVSTIMETNYKEVMYVKYLAKWRMVQISQW